MSARVRRLWQPCASLKTFYESLSSLAPLPAKACHTAPTARALLARQCLFTPTTVSCCRAGWQSAAADPTLPLGAAFAFSVWRFFDKRRKRNPDGSFWGGSPVWGAVASTLLGLFFGFVVSMRRSRSFHAECGGAEGTACAWLPHPL